MKDKMRFIASRTSRRCIIKYTLLSLISFLFLMHGRISLAENNIYRELVEREIATYEDGCRAITCFVDIPAGTMEFEELISQLKDRDIIGRKWEFKAEKPLTRGVMAYMICKILDVKGGLTMRILGTTRRYAYLECQQPWESYSTTGKRDRIMPVGNSKTYLTGHDLLALLYRIEQHVKAKERFTSSGKK